MARRRRSLAALSLIVGLAACSSSSPTSSPTSSPASSPTTVTPPATVAGGSSTVARAPATIDAARCAANKAAGTITYLSGFDFAASASIVDVLVAKQKGYYDQLCLKVDLKSSFTTSNYPLMAANQAQFASAGSYTEMVDFAAKNSAKLVALAVEGHTGIDALIVKQGKATTLADLKNTTIGVKGKITPSVKALLAQAGLVEGKDYQTVLLDGFDPKVHIGLPSIVGFPGYKSNEPGQLAAAGIAYQLFDPSKSGVPGSFGVIYTNAAFLSAHAAAAADFMRATMKGLADAIAEPDSAATTAIAAINGNGNPNFLSLDGERFRWKTEAALVTASTPVGAPIGLPDAAALQAELDAYAKAGIFDGAEPASAGTFDASVLKQLYGTDGKIVWPG